MNPKSVIERPTLESQNTFLIVGNGRLARHLSFYFESLQLKFLSWNRSQNSSQLELLIQQSTHVLLAISDSALLNFYNQHLANTEKTVVHFSGASSFEQIPCAHPLMTFGPELYTADFYLNIPFVISGAESLQELIPVFKNPAVKIFSAQKPYYHALCVLGGNFTTLLANRMLKGFAEIGIPSEFARVYLQTTLENVLKSKEQALTGPLARKDVATLEKNLTSLRNDPFHSVYKSFIEAYDPQTYSQLEDL